MSTYDLKVKKWYLAVLPEDRMDKKLFVDTWTWTLDLVIRVDGDFESQFKWDISVDLELKGIPLVRSNSFGSLVQPKFKELKQEN